MGNCTSCHTMGKSLSNDNCLQCHKEIQSRVEKKRGFHFPVREKQCTECHKEHHGRNFELIRFDKKQFNHAETGFILEGKHAQISCEQCHRKKNLFDSDVKKFPETRKEKTFLGLSKDCLQCHNDEHRGQFAIGCVQCHSMNSWKPASKFLHEKTRFILNGSHSSVACSQCHKRQGDSTAAIQYSKIEFSSCRSCHNDPHGGKFKQECSQCHSTESWHTVRSGVFDHSSTKFPLLGRHSALKCEQCHQKNRVQRNVSGETGFKITRFQKCSFCHDDAHAQQFQTRKDKGECESCHTVDGFSPSRFDLGAHSNTRFLLTGSHKAIPCGQCHRDELTRSKSKKRFQWNVEIQCMLCHNDVHAGQFKGRMKNGCETCHSAESWQTVSFSHDKTNFPLRGKHSTVQCVQCHTIKNGVTQFVGLKTSCNHCHADRHAGQFSARDGTLCERCHTERGWKLLMFDHNTQSRFALTGKHIAVQCEKCHKETIMNNKRTIKYKPMEAACTDCHPAQ